MYNGETLSYTSREGDTMSDRAESSSCWAGLAAWIASLKRFKSRATMPGVVVKASIGPAEGRFDSGANGKPPQHVGSRAEHLLLLTFLT